MRKAHLLFCVAVALILRPDSVASQADVASLGLGEYFHILSPGAVQGSVHVPLLLVFPEHGRLGSVLSGSVEDAPSGERIIQFLEGVNGLESVETRVQDAKYIALIERFEKSMPVRFPLVVLVRLKGGDGSERASIVTSLDDDWERALRKWHEGKHDLWDFKVIELDPY